MKQEIQYFPLVSVQFLCLCCNPGGRLALIGVQRKGPCIYLSCRPPSHPILWVTWTWSVLSHESPCQPGCHHRPHFLGLCFSALWGGPQNPEFIYKKFCICSYMFKVQSPSKYSPFDAIHLSRYFCHCSKQFLNSSILMPFSASAFFYFTFSTLAKHFPLGTFFVKENKKKSCLGWDQVNRKGGAWESCRFWSQTAEHSSWCGQVHS